MSAYITPSSILLAVAIVMLIACGQNFDAGNIATAIASGVSALICLVTACVKERGL